MGLFHKDKEEFEMVDVYAGPEPVNAPLKPDASMCAVYAGPDMFERIRCNLGDTNPMESQVRYPQNYMIEDTNSSRMQGDEKTAHEGPVQDVICPNCGERSRCSRFCEYCGFSFKDGSQE